MRDVERFRAEVRLSTFDPPNRRLHRAADARVVAGVAAGLAEHLAVDVVLVRIAFALLVAVSGAGILLYAAFWAVVPSPPDLTAPAPLGGRTRFLELVGIGLLAAAALAVVQLAIPGTGAGGWPFVVAGLGVALIWRQADDAQRAQWAALPGRLAWRGATRERWGVQAGSWRTAVLRVAAGVSLVGVGVAGFLAANGALVQARQGLLSTGVVVAGLALVSAPWWWRMASELAGERRERIRSQERAELAAQLHDSVLQTLVLIQRHADDPRSVQGLARGQEREPRSWLYAPARSAACDRLRIALESVAADVEEAHGVPVDVVVVGDCEVNDRTAALVQAAREAMVNAARHSGASAVSLYAEVEEQRVSLFVRDRGRGFDPAAVPADRFGIAESVVGRMARYGGTAQVSSRPGEGTEIEFRLPRGTP